MVPAAFQGTGRARWLSDGGLGWESCPLPPPGTTAPFSPQGKPHLPWELGPVDPYFDRFRPETSFPAARCRLPSGGGGPQDVSLTLLCLPRCTAGVTLQGPRWSCCVDNSAAWSLLWVSSYLLFTHGWMMFYEPRRFLTSSLPFWTWEGPSPGAGALSTLKLGWG